MSLPKINQLVISFPRKRCSVKKNTLSALVNKSNNKTKSETSQSSKKCEVSKPDVWQSLHRPN